MYRNRVIQGTLLVLPLLLAGQARSTDDKPAQDDSPKLLARLVERFNQVVPKDIEEKLQLSDEQKKKLATIQKELETKNQKLLLKAALTVSDLQGPGDRATNALDIGMLTLELVKSQRETSTKFRAILTDEQQTLYDDLKGSQRPRRRR
jgi:hypothetical protein